MVVPGSTRWDVLVPRSIDRGPEVRPWGGRELPRPVHVRVAPPLWPAPLGAGASIAIEIPVTARKRQTKPLFTTLDFMLQDYANWAIQENVVYRGHEIEGPGWSMYATVLISGASLRGAPFANVRGMDSPSAEPRVSLWRQATRDFQASREEIAARAYERYISRRTTCGSEVQDWLEAEREILQEKKGLVSK